MENSNISKLPERIELSRNEWFILTWGFFWRGVCIAFLSIFSGAVVGAVLGFLVGTIMGILKVPLQYYITPLKVVSFFLGIGINFLFMFVYIKWLLSTNIGPFRLKLIRN